MADDSNDGDAVPARVPAVVAPLVDGVFVSAMHAARDAGGRDLVMKYGGAAAAPLIDLRNPLAAGRSIGPSIVDGPYVYGDRDVILDGLRRSAEQGMLDGRHGGQYVASKTGLEFLVELYQHHADVLAERWEAKHSERVHRLNGLLERLLAAATPTGGAGWGVFAPPHEPPGSPPGRLLLNRLSTLRAHRADAHAAAWHAAALSAEQIVGMAPGSPRDKIEGDTNARAAAPYTVLSTDERLCFVADLRAMPGAA